MMICYRFVVTMVAVAMLASTSPTWSREQKTHHRQRAVSRTEVPQGGRSRVTAAPTLKEPFTAAEKRAFQEPTGKEIDRW
jgi:hypothetical protein